MVPALASESRAQKVARSYLSGLLRLGDPMVEPWRDAVLGDPKLVRNAELEPSYWIVPLLRQDKVLGYIEVGEEAKILGHTYLYQDPHDLRKCPPVVTRLTAEEAYSQAKTIMNTYAGAEFLGPFFVHDGPRNRIAWMIEVRKGGELVSQIYVTPGYVYQRKLGEKHPLPGWRG